ncbi:glutarate dioxygenase GlaH [Pontibacillus litoralis]|uniref:Protein CsiD n=1 Tax=Pontibacillus litoralis JSM 072002 TaxID=1385512 RepID=A0A0A5G4Z6_9BACI|nr:glutarate dioxygenase GlaH [Pontibacillus litoralis]KGX88196.1 protein CsiD [Pontibacillus litoralis JSM 072002]
MSIVEVKGGKLVGTKGKGYTIKQHAGHQRMYHIELENEVIDQFLDVLQDVSDEQLEYIPYMRFIVAAKLLELTDEAFGEAVRNILHDRNTGGFTIGLQERTQDPIDFVKFSTALTHLVGTPNFDAMSGKYYARFTVKHTDKSDSYLRQAYRLFTLHTDGTYVDEPTDWLLMMKFSEENAIGGRSRLLHLDDWEDLDRFYKQPLASHPFTYKAPASKNVEQEVKRQTFYEQQNKPCICFIDQFVFPETIEQSKYLKDLSCSMENSISTVGLDLPVGNLVMLNNRFWLHGREAFEHNTQLHRELLRQRGRFAK